MTTTEPTIVTIPCFSGAPWDGRQLKPFAGHKVLTMRLPEGLNDVEAYADFVAAQVADLDSYVLVGDSFGAVIALTLATRRPAGLVALVLSGGFAANPLPRWKGIASRASHFAGGPLYRQGTLRFHAFQLASKFDASGEIPLAQNDYRRLFIENTPRRSYTARVTSVVNFDIRDRLDRVNVPTLLVTPQDDKLVGEDAAKDMLAGIPGSREVVLPNTGHMFRFTHPDLYGRTIAEFIEDAIKATPLARSGDGGR
ncbi:alpha/beta hydrolase [Mycobacterium sp. OTB74]|uniref:alpha/beta fold hydrolase n=1 Tax=Mycobacterium sp. OTB74 TaxID=1853452 RepID=UPI0024731D07|nr:alpha/beta hydrolase [Mycobacterium sp. OTB74]MDH6243936.1 pimeloyl-ACP methyl ester carboxylesterase [Mycobacterium sp. OTB74]